MAPATPVDPAPAGDHPPYRVCIVGAESTGKTTLSAMLAAAFATTWVPEYGRIYTIPKDAAGEEWTTADFLHIARMQRELEDRALPRANGFLVCDTDALMTALWHEKYLGERSPEVEAIARTHTYDLTLVAGTDIPWVDDGFRDSDAARKHMQARLWEELAWRPEPIVEVRGSFVARVDQAADAIARHLGIRRPTGG